MAGALRDQRALDKAAPSRPGSGRQASRSARTRAIIPLSTVQLSPRRCSARLLLSGPPGRGFRTRQVVFFAPELGRHDHNGPLRLSTVTATFSAVGNVGQSAGLRPTRRSAPAPAGRGAGQGRYRPRRPADAPARTPWRWRTWPRSSSAGAGAQRRRSASTGPMPSPALRPIPPVSAVTSTTRASASPRQPGATRTRTPSRTGGHGLSSSWPDAGSACATSKVPGGRLPRPSSASPTTREAGSSSATSQNARAGWRTPRKCTRTPTRWRPTTTLSMPA